MTISSAHLPPKGTTFRSVMPGPRAPPSYVDPVVSECQAVSPKAESLRKRTLRTSRRRRLPTLLEGTTSLPVQVPGRARSIRLGSLTSL